MNQEDLRVRRTRRLLREAFIQLLIAHGYERLTIREITTQAQVGYKTFYRHYASKGALLNSILDELIQDFQKTLDHTRQPQTPLQNTIAALEFTQTNADLFLALAQSPAADQLLEPLLQAAMQEGAFFASNTAVPAELVVYHFASSIDALMKWWLKHETPYSIEEMALYINHLIIQPVELLKQQE